MSKLTALTALIVLTLTCAQLPDPRIDHTAEIAHLKDKIEQIEVDKMFNMITQEKAEVEIQKLKEQINNINK